MFKKYNLIRGCNQLISKLSEVRAIYLRVFLLKLLKKKFISFKKNIVKDFCEMDKINKYIRKIKIFNLNSLDVKNKVWLKNRIKINLLKFLLFKNKELMLETIIFLIYKYKLNVFLYNVLNYININNFLNYFEKGLCVIRKRVIKILRVRKRLIFKKRYNLIFYLFFFFKNAELIAKFFAYGLLKNKKHIKNIKIFLRFFYSLFIKVC